MTLSEVAACIDAHLKRCLGIGARVTYDPDTLVMNRVALKYSFGLAESSIDAATAEAYLAWLDAGNVGRHWEMEQK